MHVFSRVILFSLVLIPGITALAGTVQPDSEKGKILEYKFEKMAAFVPILATPLSGTQVIKNADGKQVVTGDETGILGKAVISFHEMTNNLKVTDIISAHGKPGQKLDPGYSYDSVFDSSGIMTSDALTTWLDNYGYGNNSGGGLVVPDFLAVSLDDIYYGINFATLLNEGEIFSNTHSVSQQFAIGSSGQHIAELPDYLFSATPISYLPGQGWVGTPLPEGTLIEYSGDHIVGTAAPEPTLYTLLVTGVVSLVAPLKKRRRSDSGR